MDASSAIRLGVGLLVGTLLLPFAQAQEIEEDQVKAAYLYNFAKFVEWPQQSFAGPGSPIVICLLGDDPFGGVLQEVVRGKTAAGRSLLVRPLAELAGTKGCHILFVSSAEWRRSRPVLANFNGTALLTVGEAPGFAASGGVIGFKLDGRRVRFQINVEAARQAAIQISSKLLSLAEIVKTRE